MNTLWDKIKFWTKVVVFGLIALVLLLFLYGNWGITVPIVDLVFHKWQDVSLLRLLFITSAVSILGWWLLWRVIGAVRGIRSHQQKSRTQKLERDVADMKAKAAMLQTKPEEPKQQ